MQTSVSRHFKKSVTWTANRLVSRASPSQVREPGQRRRSVSDVARTAR